LFTYGTETYRC